MPTALVTDAGRGSAVAIIRSLGRQGWNVVAAASSPFAPGFYSRYTTAVVGSPDPGTYPDGALDVLAGAVVRHSVDLLIPVTDEIIIPLSADRVRVASRCRVAMAEAPALERVVDKLATLELAQPRGVPIPDTVAVDSPEQAIQETESLGWPIVVKPRRSYEYRPGRVATRRWVSYAQNDAELRHAVETTAGVGALLQRFCPGAGRAVSMRTCDGGRARAHGDQRPRVGRASLGRGQRHGIPRPLGRPLSERTGGRAEAGGHGLRGGGQVRDLDLELSWITDVLSKRPDVVGNLPRRRDAIGVALRLLWPRDGYDVLSWKDLRPGLVDLAKVLTKPARSFVGGRLARRER